MEINHLLCLGVLELHVFALCFVGLLAVAVLKHYRTNENIQDSQQTNKT
jgi:hypothetical protein